MARYFNEAQIETSLFAIEYVRLRISTKQLRELPPMAASLFEMSCNGRQIIPIFIPFHFSRVKTL